MEKGKMENSDKEIYQAQENSNKLNPLSDYPNQPVYGKKRAFSHDFHPHHNHHNCHHKKTAETSNMMAIGNNNNNNCVMTDGCGSTDEFKIRKNTYSEMIKRKTNKQSRNILRKQMQDFKKLPQVSHAKEEGGVENRAGCDSVIGQIEQQQQQYEGSIFSDSHSSYDSASQKRCQLENNQIHGNIDLKVEPQLHQTRYIQQISSHIQKERQYRPPFSPQFTQKPYQMIDDSNQGLISPFYPEQNQHQSYQGQMLFIGQINTQGENEIQQQAPLSNNIKILNNPSIQESSPHNTTQFIFDSHANAQRKVQINSSSIESEDDDDEDDYFDKFLRISSNQRLVSGDPAMLNNNITTSKLDQMMRIDSKKGIEDSTTSDSFQKYEMPAVHQIHEDNQGKQTNNSCDITSILHQQIGRENSYNQESQHTSYLVSFLLEKNNQMDQEQ